MHAINERVGLTGAAVLLCTLGVLPKAIGSDDATPDAARPRNILLIISDDHGQDLGAYGNPVIQTPNLDALAAEGVLFTHAFATTASCSASRSAILTGLHNHRTGQYGHTHDYHHFACFDHIRSLPDLLSEAGYRTAIIGKHHVEPRESFKFETVLPGAGRNDVQMAENCRAFLEDDDDGRPFFLYYATHDPHRGGKTLAIGKQAPIEDTETADNFGNRRTGYEGVRDIAVDPAEVIVPGFLPDNPAARAELVEYYKSVSRLDQGVGRLLDILEKAGHADDTLVVYMSDHGIAFPGAKTTCYEPGLRSPLIVRSPDCKQPGSVNSAMVSWVDITPTLLDFASVAEPTYELQVGTPRLRAKMPKRHGLHGRSFLSILDEADPEGWDEVYASHTFHEIQMYYPMRVVRERRFKLIWNIAHGLPYPFATDLWESATWQTAYQQGPETAYGSRTVREYIHRPKYELFDLEADPLESNNLATDPEYATVLAALQSKVEAFQERTADPWLMKQMYE
jgi:N-sulfoglucosamine sulfohydrolase